MQRADQLFDGDSNWLNCMVHRDSNMPRLNWKTLQRGQETQGVVQSGVYKLKLHLQDRKLFMALNAEEAAEQTKRDANSFYVISREKCKFGNKWRVNAIGDGTYTISCQMNGVEYFVCCHSFYEGDNRDVNSKYLLAHNDPNIENTRWTIKEVEPSIYSIEQAQNSFDL